MRKREQIYLKYYKQAKCMTKYPVISNIGIMYTTISYNLNLLRHFNRVRKLTKIESEELIQMYYPLALAQLKSYANHS